MTSCCLQKSEVKNYNEMNCTWVDATSLFSRPWLVFPRCALLAGWPTASFPALSISYFFLRLAPDGLLQLFPLFQPVTFFSAWHYALFTDLKDYKPISDQSNVFQVTENGLQIFFYLSVLNTRNKNLHSNAKSVLAEALSSCFFNDPSLSFWWAIRSLLQSFKIESESVKES